MAKITYEDKVTLKGLPEIAEINKITADNMNEIKDVVNDMADMFDFEVIEVEEDV